MAVLISSVVAGAISLFNRSSTSASNINNNNEILNAKLNEVINFCMRSLPNGTLGCDNQLLPVVSKICTESNAKQVIDACSDQKVAQYYNARNIERSKTGSISKNNSSPPK